MSGFHPQNPTPVSASVQDEIKRKMQQAAYAPVSSTGQGLESKLQGTHLGGQQEPRQGQISQDALQSQERGKPAMNLPIGGAAAAGPGAGGVIQSTGGMPHTTYDASKPVQSVTASDARRPNTQGVSRPGGGPQAGGVPPEDNEWLSTLVGHMWPYIASASSKMAREMLPPLLLASKPGWMGGIDLKKFQLGNVPPTITNIMVQHEEGSEAMEDDDYIHLEMDFEWKGDQDIELTAHPLPEKLKLLPSFAEKLVQKATAFQCGIEDFYMSGRMRVAFRPCMMVMPVVGAFQISFVKTPKFNFDVTLGSGEFEPLSLMGSLRGWLHTFLRDMVLAPYIIPEHFVYKLDPSCPDLQVPEGILEISVIEAKNIPKLSMLDKPDAFVEISLRKKTAKKTKTIDNNKNPRWNETFHLAVFDKELQDLTLILNDVGVYNAANEIGRNTFQLDELVPEQPQDIWLPIESLQEQQEGESGKAKQGVMSKVMGGLGKLTQRAQPPANTSDYCAVHIRVNYTKLSDSQVKMIIDAQKKGHDIPDARLHELLKDELPPPVPAGQPGGTTSGAPTPPTQQGEHQGEQRHGANTETAPVGHAVHGGTATGKTTVQQGDTGGKTATL